MKYFHLLLLLVCTSVYGQGESKLPKSINIVPRESMPNSHLIAINFEYDAEKRLSMWTDSIYNRHAGGVIVTKNVIKYNETGKPEAIISYADGEIWGESSLIYEDKLVKIETVSKSESEENYKTSNMIILDSLNRAATFVKNTSIATTFEYCSKGNTKRAYTRPTTNKSKGKHVSSTDFSDEKLEYGNKKGIFHDVNMPSWFWLLLNETFPYIQHYNNNLQSAETIELTMYPTQKTTKQKRKISANFDSQEYPILIKGVLPNNLSITVSYY